MIERNPPALYPAPGDRHPVPVVENDQVGEFLFGRDRDRQFHGKVDAVEIRFRNILYEGGSEGRRNSLRQGSPLVGQALGLETEHLAVNLPDTLLRPGFEMLAEFRVAHPERVEHAIDPQRIPAVRLAPVGPLDNVVVIYRQPDAPQRHTTSGS